MMALIASDGERRIVLWSDGSTIGDITTLPLGKGLHLYSPYAPLVTLPLPLPEDVQKPIKCPYCSGEGRRYLFKDRDSYEGYKMANKHECTVCEGDGELFPLKHDPLILLERLRDFYTSMSRKIELAEEAERTRAEELDTLRRLAAKYGKTLSDGAL